MTSIGRHHTEFVRDGVTVVRGAFDPGGMQLAERAYRWSMEHPGPNANRVLGGQPGSFYQDHANPSAWPAYRPLLYGTSLTDLVADLMGSRSLWLLYEQIWLKHGGETQRTPWHQDLSYVPMAGDHLATAWLNLDPVPRERSLEFVLGSHRGPLYNPTAFDPVDPVAAMFAPGVWPSLPDIEAQRARWPIVSWDVNPGDLVVFHPAMLHGGAPTRANERRRTISLRFFGDDACCAARPEAGLCEVDKLTGEEACNDPMAAMARQSPGAPFRHPGFVQLR
ncbi:MAG: phytanoyl-CoA dioxygenase family protein [Candidatus Accumulibacter cognatus]|uniref:Phytanoyl-CoA dioxygenase family protein n=1 Tax=Candidatus Accumulibacter cognatus TaxID=2954383 RepID=A0A7D5NC83_9PROT|nr:MAG: phytanoyl-CoA dioxygenase family protein [Candidatus Accumulibacter cognatus]